MEKNNLLNLLNNFQEAMFYILPASIILVFSPLTSDFFEFNKVALTLVIGSLALIVWAIKAVKTKKLVLVKSPLDLGLGLLIVSAILSTIFSINKFSSLLGQYGKFFPNIFIIVLLFSLYYTLTSNISSAKVVKNIIKVFLLSTSIASLLGLLSFFNLTEKIFPVDWVKGGGFNTMGSPVTLGIIAAASFSFAVALLIKNALRKNVQNLALYIAIALLNGLYVLSIGSLPVWIVAGISLAAVLLNMYFYHFDKIIISKAVKIAGLVVVTVLAIFAITIYIPSVRESLGINYTRTMEITLDSKTSWQIATSALRDYPILGTGIATYTIDFTMYRPLSFNSTPFWNLRFNKPSNEFFRTLSEQGLLGLGALILLILSFVKFVAKSKDSKTDFTSVGLSSAIFGLMSAFVFYSANTALSVLTIILLALFVTVQKNLKNDAVEDLTLSISAVSEKLSLNFSGSKKEFLTYFFAGIVLLITVPTLFVTAKGYAAEIYRKQALTAAANGNIGLAYNLYNNVILNNPFYDTYRRDSANIDIALTALIAQKGEEITEQDKADMQQLVNQAAQEVRLTTERINPLSVTNWEHRAWIFNQLTALDENAAQAAMDAAQRAVQLDPLNPILRVGSGNVVGVGSIYYSVGDYQRAAISFSEAIQLKPDFANAYYNLSLSQAQLKNWEASATNMEIVLRLIPQDSEDFKIASDNLKILQEQAEKVREEVARQQQLEQQQNAVPAQPEKQPIVNKEPVVEEPTQTQPETQQ